MQNLFLKKKHETFAQPLVSAAAPLPSITPQPPKDLIVYTPLCLRARYTPSGGLFAVRRVCATYGLRAGTRGVCKIVWLSALRPPFKCSKISKISRKSRKYYV